MTGVAHRRDVNWLVDDLSNQEVRVETVRATMVSKSRNTVTRLIRARSVFCDRKDMAAFPPPSQVGITRKSYNQRTT